MNDQTPASAPVPAQDTPGGPGRQPDAPKPPQTAPGGFPDVQGRCPACGGASLFVGSGGYITCSRIECPNSSAATELLCGDAAAPLARAEAALSDMTRDRNRQQWYAGENDRKRKVQRERADQAEATLREVLDAFEAYWARASYCGPGETAVQPEHLQAWRATLDGKEQP